MVLMFTMFALFAAWFYKDYRWGYPEKAAIYSQYQATTAQPGGEDKWLKLSAEKGWDRVPDEINQHKIDEQKNFAVGLAVLAGVVLAVFLFNRGKTLHADDDSFRTPGGERVLFRSAYKIDKRKWRHKGLAVVYYRDESGAEKKAIIDDLKYGGADQVLERLLSQFEGEIVDLEAVPAEVPAAPSPPA